MQHSARLDVSGAACLDMTNRFFLCIYSFFKCTMGGGTAFQHAVYTVYSFTDNKVLES